MCYHLEMKLDEKRIIITGASDGIGRSIALKLASHKATMVLLGRDIQKLKAVQIECEKEGVSVEIYAFDLNDSKARDKTVEIITASGSVDILINNAGIWHNSAPLETLDQTIIETVIATNLTSQMLLTGSLIGAMKDHETAIINIVSSAGMQGRAGRTAYAASKYGMRGFTEALRDETRDSLLRIGAVFQSGTNTQMFTKAGEKMNLQKYTEPDDLADVVVFMLTRPPKLWLNEVHVSY